MAQGIQPPTKEAWELAAVVLGVLGTLYAIIRWPAKWLFYRAIMHANESCQKELKQLIDEMYAEEIKQIRKSAEVTKAHADILLAHDESIKAFGIAMRDIPRMSDALENMQGALERFAETVDRLDQNIMTHGNELGRVTGFIDGVERRRQGRRKTDPPEEHSR